MFLRIKMWQWERQRYPLLGKRQQWRHCVGLMRQHTARHGGKLYYLYTLWPNVCSASLLIYSTIKERLVHPGLRSEDLLVHFLIKMGEFVALITQQIALKNALWFDFTRVRVWGLIHFVSKFTYNLFIIYSLRIWSYLLDNIWEKIVITNGLRKWKLN